jgi:hypothetical protein
MGIDLSDCNAFGGMLSREEIKVNKIYSNSAPS